jgi:hypothetical protein
MQTPQNGPILSFLRRARQFVQLMQRAAGASENHRKRGSQPEPIPTILNMQVVHRRYCGHF